MRHHRLTKILDRKKSQRMALLRIQANHFIKYGSLTTTLAKTKFLRSFLEKLISRGKVKNLSTLRYLIIQLHSKENAKNIMEKISPKFSNRQGGYTRIFRLKNRIGDNAPLAKIVLIQNEEKSK